MIYKVIITNRFEEKYLKSLKIYFWTEEFVKILKSKKHNFIFLQDSFEKFKIKINWVHFRWVVFFILQDKIIPLFIYLKKDKLKWENINWNNMKNKIIKEHSLATNDIEKWLFKIF